MSTSGRRSAATTTVALVDCRWYGHHPTYFRAMGGALLQAGYRVLAISPAPEDCDRFVREDFGGDEEAMGRFQSVLIRDPEPLLRRFDHDPFSTHRRWRELIGALRAGEETCGWKADSLFFAWLDSFLRFATTASFPDPLGIPWSGLYFRNHHLLNGRGLADAAIRLLKGDRLLGHPRCRVVGVLDERPAEVISDRYGVETVWFPDIANASLPEAPTTLAKSIRECAGGRFVLGMISLEPRKGVIEMLRVADRCRDKPWFWVFAGPFERGWFSPGELELIDRLRRESESGEADHLFLDLSGERIPDGDDYNSVFSAFDAALAVYPGWEASSNALTKAALFEKKVLAWNGGCVGQRVREFQLGLTVDPDDVPGIVRAIECLEQGSDLAGEALRPRFAEYRDRHSLDQLQRSLARVVEASVVDVRPAT